MELVDYYPPLNGDYGPSMEDLKERNIPDLEETDYSIGSNVIYTDFAYSAVNHDDIDFNDIIIQLTENHGISYYMFDDYISTPNGVMTLDEWEEKQKVPSKNNTNIQEQDSKKSNSLLDRIFRIFGGR